jgi:hypothetical protein
LIAAAALGEGLGRRKDDSDEKENSHSSGLLPSVNPEWLRDVPNAMFLAQ